MGEGCGRAGISGSGVVLMVDRIYSVTECVSVHDSRTICIPVGYTWRDYYVQANNE